MAAVAGKSFNPGPVIAGVAWATLAQSMDGKMLSVTLPLLRGHLGATVDDANWVVIAYLMASFAVLPFSPWLSAQLGRRRYFLLSIAGFTLCALLCALSASLAWLVFWRLLQGAFGAGLIATSQAILRQILPDQKLGLSQVIFAGTFVGGPLALGPLIGGFLVDNDCSWRWPFAVDVLLGVGAVLMCSRFLPEQELGEPRPFDGVGAALLAAALIPLQFVLYEGDRYWWWDDGRIVALTLLAVGAAAAFVLWEWRCARAPLIDRTLLRGSTVRVGLLLVVPLAVVLGSVVAIVLTFAEQFLHFTATLAGELTVVRSLFFVPLVFALGVAIDRRRMSVPRLVFAGLVLMIVANVMESYATTTDSSFRLMALAFAVGGIAIAPTMVPLLWAIMRAVPRARTLEVTTLLGLGMQLGAAATPAVVQTALSQRFAFHYAVLREGASLNRLGLLPLPQHVAPAKVLTQLVTQQSFALAFSDLSLIVAAVAALGLALVPLMRRDTLQRG